MNKTKTKNNSNINKGTDAYYKRLETYKAKSDEELKNIVSKGKITKNQNKTLPKHKVERGEEFGFVNCSREKREQIDSKTKSILNSIQSNGKSLMSNVANKRVKKMREEGKYVKLEDLPDFKHYQRCVWKVTNAQKLEMLENYDKRGRADLKEDAYHLDHKFSIKKAFELNIPVYIVGNIKNLEMIHHSKNCTKQDECSITLDKLYEDVIYKGGELLETP